MALLLFLRYNRRLYPTAVGRYVVECAQKILDEQNRMLLTVKEVTGGNRKGDPSCHRPQPRCHHLQQDLQPVLPPVPGYLPEPRRAICRRAAGSHRPGAGGPGTGRRCHQQRGHRHPHCPRRTTGVPACLPPTGKAGRPSIWQTCGTLPLYCRVPVTASGSLQSSFSSRRGSSP